MKQQDKNEFMLLLMTHYGETGVRYHYGFTYLENIIGFGLIGGFILTLVILMPIFRFYKTPLWLNFSYFVCVNSLIHYTIRRIVKRICDFIECEIEKEFMTCEQTNDPLGDRND